MNTLEASCSDAQEQNIMLLPWQSSDSRDSDLDEHDEATVALLPKISDDKLPNDATFVGGSEDDNSYVNEAKPTPWWSFIWVRLLSPSYLQQTDSRHRTMTLPKQSRSGSSSKHLIFPS